MPQCSAINCANRPEKGFKLFRFPTDRFRRKKWVDYCCRKDWIPTKNSALCELHFAADQFQSENLLDGKKQLNHDAIPTIYVAHLQSHFSTTRGKKKFALAEDPQTFAAIKSVMGSHSDKKNMRDSQFSMVLKRTRRWVHAQKIDWSYDHAYSKRDRIYLEYVEKNLNNDKSAAREDLQLSSCVTVPVIGISEKHLLENEGNMRQPQGGSKERLPYLSFKDQKIQELEGALLKDMILTEEELLKQKYELLMPGDDVSFHGTEDLEKRDTERSLEPLDLYMTVDEVSEGRESLNDYGGTSKKTSDLNRYLDDLKLLEIALMKQQMKISQEDENKFNEIVDEVCQKITTNQGCSATDTDFNKTSSPEASNFCKQNLPYATDCDGMYSQESQMVTLNFNQPVGNEDHFSQAGERMEAFSLPNSFICENCGKIFDSFCLMKNHQRTHLSKKRQAHACHICHKSFLLLNRHMRIHTGEKPYFCTYCSRHFSRLDNLQNHMKCHTEKVQQSVCERCGMKFSEPHEWRLHQKIHQNELPYCCEYCGKQFLYLNLWKKHWESHVKRKQFLCNICGKQFIQANNLKEHITRTHTDENFYICSMCGKSFVRAISLRLHLYSHTGEKPHSCDRCAKQFLSSGSLDAHMKIHYDEKPYVCVVCQKCFRYSYHLKTHMRIHTGEKPYECTFCSKRFAQNGNLKLHRHVHLQNRQEYL